MQTKDLNSWEEFKECIEEIQEETQSLNANSHKVGKVSGPLYRGQPDYEWHLESTLERKHRNITLYEYFTTLKSIKSKVEEISKKSWPTFSDVNNCQLQSIYHFTIDLPQDTLGYMTFVRQHGFPSPLLDWTSCPYIASYFAFEGIDTNTEKVAIYFFRKQTGLSTDLKNALKPNMDSLGHNIANTSPRHSKQKTHYTLCMKNPNNGKNLNDYIIANIEEDINNPGFSMSDNYIEEISETGNVVRKYALPATEKKKVLRELESKEINRESLFESTPDNILIDLWNKYGM
ncbi:MAG: FRG domain-containing protein [Planctomycetota bacterium]|jgi:hypothetical protein